MGGTPKLPDAVGRASAPEQVDAPGWYLILGDTHIKHHDKATIELAIATAKKHRAVGVLLNGDILDHHGLSRFDKDPGAPRYAAEIEAGQQFLAYVRHRLPKARIIYKAGNHDERLRLFIVAKAEALFGLEAVTLPSLLEMKRHGVEWVDNKRVVRLGRLNVLHGHEFPSGSNSPVNPARGLFLRAKSVALCSHFHQTSEHHEPDITGKESAAWSIGCACDLRPEWMPYNKWNHGFAMVNVANDGTFSVRNLRVWNGKVV